MKLYLSSYKLGNQTEFLEGWIKNHGSKLALLPNARDCYPDDERKRQGIWNDAELLRVLGFDVDIVSLSDYFGQEEQLQTKLQNYPSIFAIGGNTFVLRQAMKLSGFDNYLHSIKNSKNYLYGGYSAGICLLAPSLHGLELVDDSTCNPYNCDVVFEGLGLLDYVPVPHYQSNHPESEDVNKVVEYLRRNNIPYITLRDGDVRIEDI